MGFTIEDMLVVSKDRYQMKMIAGNKGWSNSISWILMTEDLKILQRFTGKELAVTTCLGFDTEDKLLELARELIKKHGSGLIINDGCYIHEIPQSLLSLCNEYDFPLLTVPWDIYIAEMIKDLSIRIFLQASDDEQISRSLIHAIEQPEAEDLYRKNLLPFFDVDGQFQVVLISAGDLDLMDTVERRRILYRLQIYLENITHNGNLFYYDAFFILVANAVPEDTLNEIIRGFYGRLKQRMEEFTVFIGIGSPVTDIRNLKISYQRAKAAVTMSRKQKAGLLAFDNMGIYRMLYSISDERLLSEMGKDLLQPLLDYDAAHHSDYVETLSCYLKHNGSIQAVSEELYTHRNTILYRIANIRKILSNSLDTPEQRLPYQIACMILHMTS